MNWRSLGIPALCLIGMTAAGWLLRGEYHTCPQPRTVTVVEDREVIRYVQVKGEDHETIHVTAGPVRTVWRDRVVTVEGKPQVIREVVREQGPVETRQERDTVTTATTVERAHDQHITVTQPAARPLWAVTARVGTRIGTPLELPPTYGGGVERRLLGGLWVGLEADSSKSAAIRLRWEW